MELRDTPKLFFIAHALVPKPVPTFGGMLETEEGRISRPSRRTGFETCWPDQIPAETFGVEGCSNVKINRPDIRFDPVVLLDIGSPPFVCC